MYFNIQKNVYFLKQMSQVEGKIILCKTARESILIPQQCCVRHTKAVVSIVLPHMHSWVRLPEYMLSFHLSSYLILTSVSIMWSSYPYLCNGKKTTTKQWYSAYILFVPILSSQATGRQMSFLHYSLTDSAFRNFATVLLTFYV